MVVLDQQGRIRALFMASAYLLKAEADRTGAPNPMLAAIRGMFALFGAALAALHGLNAAASNAGSSMQLEEMIRLTVSGTRPSGRPDRLCHGNRAGAQRPSTYGRPHAAAAACHCAIASARKARSVRREIRWR